MPNTTLCGWLNGAGSKKGTIAAVFAEERCLEE
jgi:hypothetical protein